MVFFFLWLLRILCEEYEVELIGTSERNTRIHFAWGKQFELETKMNENYNRNLQTLILFIKTKYRMCVMYIVVMLNDNGNGVRYLTFNILFHTTYIIES